ncbi:hypothetical protein EYZ11_010822 [Aspergillus tanneri]|uniref:Uncharacterized protein n=1 Tax=Aspergillus tanneri TaxID=1220188 RepID=A0A4S3J4Z1_9EURO|nr:uncharacterized protein ATNIH1004_000440 [Aspergillus tanneri]KAA8651550.1 hypothetical protein ATNIH1004_000440 [Aspergillus tanneri]THC89732.1 hypothetical protein EYZ11_010822 [Aspergillus tanneri]
MGQRHNRRRTRPRSRNRSIDISSVEPASLSASCLNPATSHTVIAAYDSLDAIPIYPAPTWHNGYMIWQKRDRTSRLEAVELEAERYRVFGGVPGDDVGLCYRMLEYFGGLDYIDSSQCLTPLPG